jgi:PAS domain S-box-containing protein
VPVAAPSADKVAIIQEYFDAFNRRDVEGWVGCTHPDVTLSPTPYWAPPGTSYHGRVGLRTYAHEMFRRLPYLWSEPTELRDLGDHIFSTRSVASGADEASATSRNIAFLLQLKDGYVHRIEAFQTEGEALETVRRRSQDQFGLLFRHALDALVLIDDDARFIDSNVSASELYGLSADELRGRMLFEFTPPELVDRLEALWRTVRRNGYAGDESAIVSGTGESLLVEFHAKADFVPGRHLLRIQRAETISSERPPGSGLTAREREVFSLLALGLSSAEVADRLVISPHTVKTHVEKGIARLEAKNRVHAIALALKRGEIHM